MAQLKPQRLPIKRFLEIESSTLNELDEGMLISFNYYGETINDFFPFVYVLEKRMDRIYGLNLRYLPKEFVNLMNLKSKQLDKKLKEQIKIIKKENKGVEFDEEMAIVKLKKQIPKELLIYFDNNIKEKKQGEILRNYIPKNMHSIRKFKFKVL